MTEHFEAPGLPVDLLLQQELTEAALLFFPVLDKTVHSLQAAVAAIPPEKIQAAREPLPQNATETEIAAKRAAVQELFIAQKDIFLNSPLGLSQLELWAAAHPAAVAAYLYPDAQAATLLTPQDAQLVTFFTNHPQLENRTLAEKKEVLEKLKITQEDEDAVKKFNEMLKNDPALLKEIVDTLTQMQVAIRKESGVQELQEKQEYQHINTVVDSITAVTQSQNPLAIIDAVLHDIHKYRPNSSGVAVMNLFLHEENSQIAAADSVQRILAAKLLKKDQENVEEVAAMILSVAKATAVIVGHHGHGEFPRGKAQANDEYIPEMYQGILGVPEAKFGEGLYPHAPELEAAIPAQFSVIRETAALVNALDAATGCLIEAFAKNNNTYSSKELADTPLLIYLTMKLTNSFDTNLTVPGAQLLLAENPLSEAGKQLAVFQEGLKQNKNLYQNSIAADLARIQQGLELSAQGNRLKEMVNLHEKIRQNYRLAMSLQLPSTIEANAKEIMEYRKLFNENLNAYIEELAATAK